MTAIELVTKEDLIEFKKELITEIRTIIHPQQGQSKKWLRSSEVRRMLSISPGTLQNLRINGSLSFTKIGGIMYYKAEDINNMMEGRG